MKDSSAYSRIAILWDRCQLDTGAAVIAPISGAYHSSSQGMGQLLLSCRAHALGADTAGKIGIGERGMGASPPIQPA